MKEVKDALLRMVKAGRETKKLMEAYVTIGLNDNPLFDIYGNIADAIYYTVGERTETFNESVTKLALEAPILTDERRTEILYSEWKKNHTELPKPNVCTTAEIFKMFNENGGYMHETPEGDWS